MANTLSLFIGVVVKYIDFGNDEILSNFRDVQPLKPYFGKLPAQVID